MLDDKALRNPFPRTGLAAGFLLICFLGSGTLMQAADTRGFMYGKVTTENGSVYEGRIRWGNEEAFWGDFFNSTKDELPHMKNLSRSEGRRRERIKIFGITIGTKWSHHDSSRVFKTRFGDIREIRPRSGDSALLIMKDGTEYRLDGGSNDLGTKIQVWDEGIGEVELQWQKIDTIEFLPTPRRLRVEDHRLHGTVQSDAGEFRGFIQWDQDECVSSDKLDGESRDGDLALRMGKIRTIERRSSSSSSVTLKDGREFVLDGTNDVDKDNRGIFVEDPRFGRVLVSWEAFERVDFSDPGDSGPAYDDFEPGAPLRGRVTDTDGRVHSGEIVFDLDESRTWEMLDGDRRDVAYAIPFGMIASVIPTGRDTSRVLLRGGLELDLEDEADVGEGNAGVLILKGEEREAYVPWDEVERVDFEN